MISDEDLKKLLAFAEQRRKAKVDGEEKAEMRAYLETAGCPSCGNLTCVLDGNVYYTGPLGWGWKCSTEGCDCKGVVSYAHLPHVDFDEHGEICYDEGPIEMRID